MTAEGEVLTQPLAPPAAAALRRPPSRRPRRAASVWKQGPQPRCADRARASAAAGVAEVRRWRHRAPHAPSARPAASHRPAGRNRRLPARRRRAPGRKRGARRCRSPPARGRGRGRGWRGRSA